MLFNSFEYFIYFIAVIPLYYLLRSQNLRIWWLLLASCVFYMYFVPAYILILFAVILIDYSCALAISKQTSQRGKRLFLFASIASNLSILFFFKYFNFFMENAGLLCGRKFPGMEIILPIGLSFHTFQSLSYIIEVYRGNFPAEKRAGVFALYVMFFPQLVAGPIERPQNIIHQLKEKQSFRYDRFLQGIWLISAGLIKKSILADRLSIYVDGVYSHLPDSSPYAVLLAVVFFSFQIYFDFSGYSDIALGSARCMGIELMQNFNKPYKSRSLKEFWTRWHISLSSWFRDYVFIPLGGNRVSKLKHFRNIMIVFGLSGLWHGASWNFVLWGVIHGLLVYGSAYARWSFEKLHSRLWFLDVVFNFMIVSLLWIFFRAPDFITSTLVFEKLAQLPHSSFSFIRPDFGLVSLLIVFFAFAYLAFMNNKDRQHIHGDGRTVARLTLNFIFIFVFGIFNDQSFIYFQF